MVVDHILVHRDLLWLSNINSINKALGAMSGNVFPNSVFPAVISTADKTGEKRGFSVKSEVVARVDSAGKSGKDGTNGSDGGAGSSHGGKGKRGADGVSGNR